MKHYRCQQADLEMHARVWDRVCDVLFNGHKPEPFEPTDDVPDDMPDYIRYRCVNGHDLCDRMYPGPDCPYCERVIEDRGGWR